MFNPLKNLDKNVENIKLGALGSFKSIMNMNLPDCPIQDGIYTNITILEPWMAHAHKTNLNTVWLLKNTGLPGNYGRWPSEVNTAYFSRVYNPCGKCKGSTCCLNSACGQPYNGWCNAGAHCNYICQKLRDAMLYAYPKYLTTDKRSTEIRTDLGVSCPAGTQCPSLTYRNKIGMNRTVIGVLEDYKTNLTKTKNDIVKIFETTIGDVLASIQDFLCNMNAPFVATRYYQVQTDMCLDFLGGLSQITLAVWFLACVMHLVAGLGAILAVRLRGSMNSQEEDFEEINNGNVIKDV